MRSGGLIVWIHCLFVIYLVLAAIICCQVLHSHVNGNDVQIEVLYQHCDKSLPKGGILDATYLHENVKSDNPLPPPWISIGTFAFYFMKHSVSFCHGAATFSLWQAATTTLTVAIVLGCSVLLLQLVGQPAEFSEPLPIIWPSLQKAVPECNRSLLEGFENKINGQPGQAVGAVLSGSDRHAQTQTCTNTGCFRVSCSYSGSDSDWLVLGRDTAIFDILT